MTQTVDQLSLTRALAFSKNEFFLACASDEDDVGYPFNRLSHYKDGAWTHRDYAFWISSLSILEEDEVRRMVFVGGGGEFVHQEVTQTIVSIFDQVGEEEKGLEPGRINALNQIGKHLYACGDSGRNYKRHENGTWQVFETDLLEKKQEIDNSEYIQFTEMLGEDPSLGNDKQFMEDLMKSMKFPNPTTTYMNINGLSKDGIYLCGGKGNISSALKRCSQGAVETLFFDYGRKQKYTPSLNHILFEDGEERMRVCGQDGAMLVGNARDGFIQDPAATKDMIYYNMAWFGGKLYMATHLGLHVHTGDQITPLQTGLEPDATDTHKVEAVDGVLWVFGIKDILRFDGDVWERIPYPGNDPV